MCWSCAVACSLNGLTSGEVQLVLGRSGELLGKSGELLGTEKFSRKSLGNFWGSPGQSREILHGLRNQQGIKIVSNLFRVFCLVSHTSTPPHLRRARSTMLSACLKFYALLLAETLS